MNSYHIFTLAACWMACLLLAACTTEELPCLPDATDRETTVRILVPAATIAITRANGSDETCIENLYVAEYDADGKCTALRPADTNPQADGSYLLTLKPLKSGTTEVHLLANAQDVVEDYNSNVSNLLKPDNLFSDKGKAVPFMMWGSITREALKTTGDVTVSLIRNVAKATITMDAAINGNRVIEGWKIINTACEGSLAYTTQGTPNAKDGDLLNAIAGSTDETGSTDGGQTLYFFETPVAKGENNIDTRIVLKSDGKYYTACFLGTDGKRMPLLRNHHYLITVKRMDAGYNTEEEALKAPPGNVKLEIKDHNCLITHLISNGMYELGTCDTVRIGSDAGTDARSAYFVIMRGEGAGDGGDVTVSGSTDWITGLQIDETKTTDIASSDYSSAGKQYTLSFSFSKNLREEVRRAEIEIKFMTLTGRIVVEQKGCNLKQDRTTTIYGLPGDDTETGKDYIEFLTKEVKGAAAADMGGRGARNNGLQLGMGPMNNYTYKIRKVTGDKLKESGSSTKVCVTEDGEYIIIEATDKNDTGNWIEQLTITTADGIEIVYDLYHTGIFWQLPAGLNAGKSSENPWCYYEMVESEIENVYLLDRNIGATSVDDVGIHCLLINGDKSDPIANICPPGFVLPTASLWKSILPGLKTVTSVNVDGSSFPTMELSSADGKGIRFPFGGFNNGFTLENEGIGYYWSKSLVAGNQGFDVNSPEYGYWYNIARISTGGSNLMSIRYVDGSNGENGGHYKHLSTRCVLDNGSATEKNRLTIHDRRPDKSKALFIYIATEKDEYRNRKCGEMIRAAGNDTEATLYYDMIDPETIKHTFGEETGKLYIFFREGEDLKNEGWIDNRVLIGDTREFTVTQNTGTQNTGSASDSKQTD